MKKFRLMNMNGLVIEYEVQKVKDENNYHYEVSYSIFRLGEEDCMIKDNFKSYDDNDLNYDIGNLINSWGDAK